MICKTIQQPLHNVWWLTAEGEYKGDPGTKYGAGRLEIWDKGICKRIVDGKNNLVFEIVSSKKMTGRYVLHRLRKTNWILFKVK